MYVYVRTRVCVCDFHHGPVYEFTPFSSYYKEKENKDINNTMEESIFLRTQK